MRKLAVGNEFVAAATTALGHPIEVVAGDEEARLVYSGVMQGRSRARPRRRVVDIGGGSTGLSIGRGDRPDGRRVGKAGVSTCRTRWPPIPKKTIAGQEVYM